MPANNSLRLDAAMGGKPASDSATPGLRQNDKSLRETTGQASRPIRSGRIYAEVNAPINTGLAIVNPNATPATVSFAFTGATGDFGSGSLTIPANGNISKFLDEDPFYAPMGFQGMLRFTSDLPVGVTTVRGLTNERNDFLTTTLPLVDVDPGNGTAFLPYFADGDGWSTEVILVNPTDDVLTGTVQFATAAGGVAGVTIAGRVDSSFNYSIPTHASQKLVTAGSGPATLGSIRVVPAESAIVPTAFAVFSHKSNGVTVSEASVRAIVGTASR
jgi:hypothetical protein